MSRGTLILLLILALPLAEIAAFWLAAEAIGFLGAFLLLIGLSATGLLLLAWLGRRLLAFFGRNLQRAEPAIAGVGSGVFLTVLGAVLLTIPGFLSGTIGILLLLPPARGWLAARFGPMHKDGVVDLEESEWERLPDPKIENRGGRARKPQ